MRGRGGSDEGVTNMLTDIDEGFNKNFFVSAQRAGRLVVCKCMM